MLGIFSRQSTNKQQSIPFQKELGEKFAATHGLRFRHYEEKGISGGAKLDERSEFTRLMHDIQDGVITKVFVWVQDRAEREPLTWHTLCNVLLEANAELYENGELIELENDMVYMMRGITSLMNRSERRKNNKRVKEKLVANAEKGKIFAMVPYGYTKDKDKLMVVDEEEAEVIRLIFKLSLDGKGYKAISHILNDKEIPTRYNKLGGSYDVNVNRNNNLAEKMVTYKKVDALWVSGTIKNIIHNRTYIGFRTFSSKEYPCPAIISKEDFDKVQANIKDKVKKTGRRSKNNFLLNDITRCNKCGKRYTGRKVNKHLYYRCSSLIKTGGSCGNSGVIIEMLDAFVWKRFFIEENLIDLVKKNLENDDTEQKIQNHITEISKKENELKSLEKKRRKIVDHIIAEDFSKEDGKRPFKLIEDQKGILEKDIINLNEVLTSLREIEGKKEQILIDKKTIEDNTPYLEKKRIIEKYIKTIHIDTLPKEIKDFRFIFIIDFKLPIGPETYITMGNEFVDYNKANFKIVP